MDDDPRSRNERRQARKAGELDTTAFLKLADRFIDLANRENESVQAMHLHMAFLFASSRYSAHVARNVLNVDDHERFVEDMLKSYAEMLRNNLADPGV
jgi:hypothetical protein